MRIETHSVAPVGWDAYVASHAAATAYHSAAAVEIGRAAFGLKALFLVARGEHDRIVGILPLVEQSSLLFGRFLVSLPFVMYGGVLANDEDVASALAIHAGELGRQRGADHVELRHTRPMEGLAFPERLDKVSMVLGLPRSLDALAKQLGSKLRSQVRRAEREKPQVAWGGVELVPDFYRVFAMSMHALGTPVYPQRFFEVVCTALGGSAAVLVIRAYGSVQAAAIVVHHPDRIEVPWAAATATAKQSALNMRMYWELLCHAVSAGAQAFDFGRSSVDSGTYRFKAQWGARPMQLHWHYWLPEGAAVPHLNHSNLKYALAGRAWRLMPLRCANLLGPHIARHLP